MKFKEYFFATIIFLLLSVGLILLDVFEVSQMTLPVFVLAAVVLFFASWKKPNWMFWLFLVFLPLEKIIVSPVDFPISIRPFQLVGFVLIAVLMVKLVFGKKEFDLIGFGKDCPICKLFSKKNCELKKGKKYFGVLDRAVLLLVVFAFLGIINAPDQAVSLKMAVILTSFVALFWLARNFLQTNIQKLEALWFFAVGAVPVVLLGLYQAIAFNVGWPHFEVFAGRINATFTEPDWLGIYLAFLLALELLFLIAAQNEKFKKTKIGKFSSSSILVGAVFVDTFFISVLLLLTVSRSAWIGAVVVGVAFLAGLSFVTKKSSQVIGKNFAMLVLIAISSWLFVGLTGLSSFHFANRAASSVSGMQKITISCQQDSDVPVEIENVSDLEKYNCQHIDLEEIDAHLAVGNEVKEVYRPDPNVEIRKNIYSETWSQIKTHPILGQGLGSSAVILGIDEHGSGFNASNVFLEVWLSMGIGGLLVIVFLLFFPMVKAKLELWDAKRGKVKIGNVRQLGLLFVFLTSGAIIIPNLFNSGLLLGFFWVWLAGIISVAGEVE